VTLNSGERLGPYEIVGAIGAGGMGEVYRARDTKLGREVALKVLPAGFAADAERLGRFEREAKVLASLNHPNIASIYGFEDSGSTRALVMELVEGPTLTDRIKAGAIPLDEALPIAKQIAEGLEYAHERGIVHRDLKPANVKLTANDAVKILDFGLAKALEGDPGQVDISSSPTISRMATQAGIILGTAAYMSPEQAKGKSVDRRTDIWSFGCVLYEMLTGQMPFSGETVTDTLAAVIRAEPEWSRLPAETPPAIRNLLARCLKKDPKQRLRDIGEARIVIEEAISGAGAIYESLLPETSVSQRLPLQRALPWSIAGVLAAALVAVTVFALLGAKPQPQHVRHLTVDLPPGLTISSTQFPEIALSPDGTDLVFSGQQGGKTQLYQRRLDDFTATAIAGTEGGISPFFSPDGRSVAFVIGTTSAGTPELRKISLAGGPVQTLCTGYDNYPGSWSTNGNIYFSNTHFNGLMQVPGSGGNCQDLTKPDASQGEEAHLLPQVLPSGESVLFTISRGFGTSGSSVAALSLKTGKWQVLIRDGTSPHYAPGGYLIYSQNGFLMAAPFDATSLNVSGSPVPVFENVLTNPSSGVAQLSMSNDGTLAYIAGSEGEPNRQIMLVDRSGKSQVLTKSNAAYEDLDLSPDGHEIAMTVEGPTWGIWTYDIPRGILSRFTFGNDNRDPFWSPDGKHIAYTSLRNGKYGVYWKPANGSGSEELLSSSPDWITISSFSPDGEEIAINEEAPDTGFDIMILPLDGKGKLRPFLRTRFNEEFAQFSPDGHWLAYQSDESGRNEVYVQPYPGPVGKWQISNDGGSRPEWSRDGRELFYLNGDKLMAVPIQIRPAFTPGTPHMLWEGNYFPSGHYYDVMPGAKQFLFIKQIEQPQASEQISVILNWFDELKRIVAAQKQ